MNVINTRNSREDSFLRFQIADVIHLIPVNFVYLD